MPFANVDISGVDTLAKKMDEYGDQSGKIVQQYLKDDGYRRIATHIPGLIHASGRKWKGKATSATSAGYTSVFQGQTSSLTLTVSSRKRYNYLYFPDDGSNTRRHAGNQQFMRRGAEDASGEIADELVERLTAAF